MCEAQNDCQRIREQLSSKEHLMSELHSEGKVMSATIESLSLESKRSSKEARKLRGQVIHKSLL